jgi:signal transduction histidine kinase
MKSFAYKKLRSFAILLLLVVVVVVVVVVVGLLLCLRDFHEVDSSSFRPKVTLIHFSVIT